MAELEQVAVDTIRAAFDRVTADGLNAASVVGATDKQIDAAAAAQGVATVPVAVREVLRLIGVRHGLWCVGSSFGVEEVGGDAKRHALATLSQMVNPLVDADGMLVLVEHQSYEFHIIDGAHLNRPDPCVWLLSENESIQPLWHSVTDWVASISPNIAEYRYRLELLRSLGRRKLPGWADHLTVDEA